MPPASRELSLAPAEHVPAVPGPDSRCIPMFGCPWDADTTPSVPTLPLSASGTCGCRSITLLASARIAFDDGRAMLDIRDVLRAIARDEGASRLLAGLGVDLDVLRQRLDSEPPTAT